MLAHSLFVLVAVTGLKLDWKSPPRHAAGVTWREAVVRLSPMTIVIALHALGIAAIQAGALVWLAPVALPLLLAVPLAVFTSHVALGDWARSRGVLLIPEESRSPAVLRRAWRHADVGFAGVSVAQRAGWDRRNPRPRMPVPFRTASWASPCRLPPSSSSSSSARRPSSSSSSPASGRIR